MRPLGEEQEAAGELRFIPDAAPVSPSLLHPYHAYVSPRTPADDNDDSRGHYHHDKEEQQRLAAGVEEEEGEEDSKPLRQLRAYLHRQKTLAARPWWRLRLASYLLLVLVGLCYLGGRSLLLRYVFDCDEGADPSDTSIPIDFTISPYFTRPAKAARRRTRRPRTTRRRCWQPCWPMPSCNPLPSPPPMPSSPLRDSRSVIRFGSLVDCDLYICMW
jgi:hypothetical protein